MPADPYALRTGTELGDGRYEVDHVLGQGGFGITYRARDRRLERQVAIKEFFMAGSSREGTTVRVPETMKPQVEERMDRIRDEARILGRFRHPSIVAVHEFFEENDSIYVVMELLEGTSLRQLIDRAGGPLPEPDVVRYGRDIATALAAVHAQNLLHRDIKPDNVMIMADGDVVLVDFGTAREFSLEQSSIMSQTLSPAYAPVEQYSERGRFGPTTDLYALGATMYHMATGVVPTSSLDRFTGHDLKPVHEVNPAVSLHLSQAIMWAMNVEAADRPQSADAFLAVLEGGAVPDAPDNRTRTVSPAAPPPAGGATASVPPPTGAPRPQAAAPQPAAAAPRVATARRKRRGKARRGARRLGRTLVNIIITLAIAIAATLAVALWFNRSSDAAEPPPAAYEISAPTLVT